MGTTRDYYADLELSPSADIQEIKKQFRKLALKYHPDRNPGREQEVNSKFQIIQTAHEILGDPQQKAKYDATLSRTSRYPTASGVKGNPWQNVSQQFPTPPRRNQPTRNAQSGAQRWNTRFAAGVPPTAKQQASADSETKKNAYQAFENMRSRQTRPGTKETRRESQPAAPPPPPPRSETARQRAQASFGNRKSGFYPSSPTPGDEPSVDNKNYFSKQSAERPRPEEPNTRQSRPGPIPDPLSQFRDKAKDQFADDRQSTPYIQHGGEKLNPFDGIPLGRAKSTRESSRYAASNSSTAASSPTSKPRSSSVPKRTGNDQASPGLGVPQDDKRPHTTSGTAGAAPFGDQSTQEAASNKAANNESPIKKPDNNGQSPSIFSFPVDDDTFKETMPGMKKFARSSVDDINTNFVHEEPSPAWKFSAGGAETGGSPVSRSPVGSRSGRRSPPKRPSVRRVDSTIDGPSNAPASDIPENKFDAQDWSDKFGPHTFVPQPTPGSTISPTRNSRANSKKNKPVKPTGAFAVPGEGSSDEDTYEWRGRKAQPPTEVTDSPQAMDIDSPMNEPAEPSPQQPQSVRNINVEPSRPDWRSGDAQFKDANGDTKLDEAAKKQFHANAVGSEDSEEFRTNFNDLKNVEPLTQEASGLKSFDDLKDTLPFESQASGAPPIKLPKAQPLVFPSPPTAPRLPPTVAISGLKPNMSSWEKYLKEFEAYLQQWDVFNRLVVDHFMTRKLHIAQTRSSKGYGFLGTRGDNDVREYYNWVQQDNEVRRKWTEACEDHEKRFREFMAFRERMK